MSRPAYSVRTLAERWGCSEGLVRKLIRAGELKRIEGFSLLRISPDEVDRYEGNEPPADRAPSAVDTKPHGAEMPPTITYHSRTPDWPQGMKRGTAAAYCDLSEQAFQAEVSRGRLPKPTKLGGENHWYRPSIDKALLDLFAPKEEWSDDDV